MKEASPLNCLSHALFAVNRPRMAHPAWCLLEDLPLSQSQETTIFKGGGGCTCACVGVNRDKRLLAVMSGDVRQVRGV